MSIIVVVFLYIQTLLIYSQYNVIYILRVPVNSLVTTYYLAAGSLRRRDDVSNVLCKPGVVVTKGYMTHPVLKLTKPLCLTYFTHVH